VQAVLVLHHVENPTYRGRKRLIDDRLAATVLRALRDYRALWHDRQRTFDQLTRLPMRPCSVMVRPGARQGPC
jgi:hypothetical protein